jgi:anti-sigma factor RsiW
MKCDTGQLRAYLDNALLPSARTAVTGHLAGCETCRAELAALKERRALLHGRLTALEPPTDAVPHPARALTRFRAEAQRVRSSLWDILWRGAEMTKQTLLAPKWRPFAVGVTAVLCLAILFSFAPVRQVAADFLGLFRVRKFAVVAVDPAKGKQLESLAQMADAGKFGQPTVVREPGPGQAVADAAEASLVAGFKVRVPSALPESAIRRSFTVDIGPAMHYEMDRPIMQAILDATGIQNVQLPDVEKLVFDVDVPTMIVQSYRIGNGTLSLVQLPSPEVNVPAGIDPVVLGEAAFQFLGMNAEDARRLAHTIDWSSTVVIPLPTDVAQYREVTVDGVTGLLLEEKRTSRAGAANTLLIWQCDGIVYGLNGTNVDVKVLLQVADSLR